mmetsp:Transcript_27082/g.59937  ORF Transcript_27082/g.59937 Transcript_27082/m.59937 type:complete len:218 (-) Transcript_27082:529-1182(-)
MPSLLARHDNSLHLFLHPVSLRGRRGTSDQGDRLDALQGIFFGRERCKTYACYVAGRATIAALRFWKKRRLGKIPIGMRTGSGSHASVVAGGKRPDRRRLRFEVARGFSVATTIGAHGTSNSNRCCCCYCGSREVEQRNVRRWCRIRCKTITDASGGCARRGIFSSTNYVQDNQATICSRRCSRSSARRASSKDLVRLSSRPKKLCSKQRGDRSKFE